MIKPTNSLSRPIEELIEQLKKLPDGTTWEETDDLEFHGGQTVKPDGQLLGTSYVRSIHIVHGRETSLASRPGPGPGPFLTELKKVAAAVAQERGATDVTGVVSIVLRHPTVQELIHCLEANADLSSRIDVHANSSVDVRFIGNKVSLVGLHVLEPWNQPNGHGEMPGGLCCQRAMGERCFEHDPGNYDENYLPKKSG